MNVRTLGMVGAGIVYCIATVCCARTAAQVTGTRPLVGLQENRPDIFLLQNARLVVAPGRVIENASLRIQGGVITAVGSDLSTNAARVIDVNGKTIYPGLIEAYSEVKLDRPTAGTRHWNGGVTPQLSVAENYKADKKTNQRYRKSGFVARLVAPSGGQVKGVSAVVSTRDDDADQVVLKDDTALHLSLTVQRGGGEGFPDSPMGALTLVRQTFYDAQWYRDAWRAYRADNTLPRPEKNVALAALVRQWDQSLHIMVDAPNERYALRADRVAREFGLPIVMRGSGREYRRLQEVVETGRALIVPVDFAKAPDVSTPEAARAATLERLMHWDLAPENPGLLAAAGVRMALTTHGLDKTSEFLPAVRKAIHRGLSSDDALRALTVEPARLLGIDDRLGSLEVGKMASFLITDGDLFAEKTKLLEIWIEGQREELHKPPVDVRGTWKIQLMDGDSEAPFEVALKGTPKKLSGKCRDKKLRTVTWRYNRLSFDIPAAPWEREGVMRMTLLVEGQPTVEQVFLGSGMWPDGTGFSCQGTWQPPETSDDGDDDKGAEQDEGDKADLSGEGSQIEEAGEEDADPSTDTAGKLKPAGDAKGANNEASKSESESKNDDAEDDKPEQPTDALYGANYPLGAFGRDQIPPQPEALVFTNATVWTNTDQGILKEATVLVRRGKIISVGTDVEVPEGAEIVDLEGQYLTPGIIDCHSHIATDGGVNESSQAVTAEVRIGDFVDPDDISIYRQLAGGVTAANVLHGSANPIGGQNQVIKMRWGVPPESLKFENAPPGIKFALGENVKQSNWGDDHTSRYPQTRMGVDEIIADAFERAKAYAQAKETWRSQRQGLPHRLDLELEALSEVLGGQRWIHCHSYRQSEILALMKTCDRYGITIGTFQHILEGYKVADEMARRGIMGSAFSDWWAYKFEVYDAIPYAGALMHNAGVVVSYNSDDAELGRHLNIEAAKAMRYGDVPAEEALKFVTLNAARQLRIDERVGSIAPGKDADLAVWNRSPLSVYAVCKQTWVDGRRYFSRDDDRQLRQRDKKRHAALVQRILSTKADQLSPDEDDKAIGQLWPREDVFCHGHGGHGHE